LSWSGNVLDQPVQPLGRAARGPLSELDAVLIHQRLPDLIVFAG